MQNKYIIPQLIGISISICMFILSLSSDLSNNFVISEIINIDSSYENEEWNKILEQHNNFLKLYKPRIMNSYKKSFWNEKDLEKGLRTINELFNTTFLTLNEVDLNKYDFIELKQSTVDDFIQISEKYNYFLNEIYIYMGVFDFAEAVIPDEIKKFPENVNAYKRSIIQHKDKNIRRVIKVILFLSMILFVISSIIQFLEKKYLQFINSEIGLRKINDFLIHYKYNNEIKMNKENLLNLLRNNGFHIPKSYIYSISSDDLIKKLVELEIIYVEITSKYEKRYTILPPVK